MTKTPVPIREKEGIDKIKKHYPERPKKMFSLLETFGIDFGPKRDDNGKLIKDENGNTVALDKTIQGYEAPTEYTPALNKNYIFPEEETLAVLMGMNITPKEPILLVGPTGVGKTALIEQIAARLNYGVMKISFDTAIMRNDLVGEWVVKGNNMTFQYGVIPLAFCMPGTILLLDEWDAQNEETAYVLQRPLQREDRALMLLETQELVRMHPDNIICATSNTNGQGDDTGLYSHGTRVQSYAQLNRFSITVRLDYLPAEKEQELLVKEFPELDHEEAHGLVKAINKVRDGYANGQISVPLSTRDLLNWADKYIRMSDCMKAAKYCFLNRMNLEDEKVCRGILQHIMEIEQ